MSYFREHFSVENDVSDFESRDKLAVGQSVPARCRIDSDIPKSAEVSLFLAPMREHMLEGVRGRFFHPRDFGISAPAIPLGALSQIFSSFVGGYASFDSWHIIKSKFKNKNAKFRRSL